jgi:hypothetical protein
MISPSPGLSLSWSLPLLFSPPPVGRRISQIPATFPKKYRKCTILTTVPNHDILGPTLCTHGSRELTRIGCLFPRKKLRVNKHSLAKCPALARKSAFCRDRAPQNRPIRPLSPTSGPPVDSAIFYGIESSLALPPRRAYNASHVTHDTANLNEPPPWHRPIGTHNRSRQLDARYAGLTER